MVDVFWEIWCSNWETGRFEEKLGDSRENQESMAGTCMNTMGIKTLLIIIINCH